MKRKSIFRWILFFLLLPAAAAGANDRTFEIQPMRAIAPAPIMADALEPPQIPQRIDLPCPAGYSPFGAMTTRNNLDGGLLYNFCYNDAGTLVQNSGGSSVTTIPSANVISDYQFNVGDNPCAEPDSSGNGNTIAGCSGTAPAIAANSGGLVCSTATGSLQEPAVALTAKTILFYMSQIGGLAFTTGSNQILGNTASEGSLEFYNSNGVTGAGASILMLNSSGGSSRTNAYYAPWGNAFGLAWAFDTNDRLYFNGVEYPTNYFSVNGSSAGQWSSGTNQICGFSPSVEGFNGTIFRKTDYSSVLTPTQIAQWYQATVLAYQARGVAPNVGNPNPINQVSSLGDSILQGAGSGIVVLSTIALPGTWSVFNGGIPATTCKSLQNDLAVLLPQLSTSAANVFVPWCGVNDITAGETAAQVAGYVSNFCRQVHAFNAAAKCLYTDVMDHTGQSANNEALNAYVRANYQTLGIDGLADMGDDPNIGCSGCFAVSKYSGDGLHPTTFAAYNDQNPIIEMNFARTVGPQNFASANVYASASGGAITTTAGSETGNTINLTSAGWTAGQFAMGTRAHCTGFTPAGYNDVYPGWTITANTGTVLSFYSSVTGLGAVTVQGSCIGTVQQDTDKYSVLSFTGNWTMESCLGLAGPNARVYVVDTNASGATAVPWDGETISGSTALAQNVVAGFESQVTSATAGGCSWRRIQ